MDNMMRRVALTFHVVLFGLFGCLPAQVALGEQGAPPAYSAPASEAEQLTWIGRYPPPDQVPGANIVAPSQEFNELIRLVTEVYTRPRGLDLPEMVIQLPEATILAVAEALSQQRRFIGSDPARQQLWDRMFADLGPWAAWVAEAHNRRHGGYLDPTKIALDARRSAQGLTIDIVKQQFNVEPANVPATTAFGGEADYQAAYSKAFDPLRRKKSPTQIDLLGQKPSEEPNAALAAFNRGVDYFNAAVAAFSGGNKEGAEALTTQANASWKEACDLGWNDGCRTTSGVDAWSGKVYCRWGAITDASSSTNTYMPYWGEKEVRRPKPGP